MQEVADRLHDFYQNAHDEVIDVGVSMDGTWMKCGHLSQFGAVATCACETGEIVDHEVMSLHCDK